MYFKKQTSKFKLQKTYGMAISDAFILRAPTTSRNPFDIKKKIRPLRIGISNILFNYKQNNTPRVWCYRNAELEATELPEIKTKLFGFVNNKTNKTYTLIKIKKALKIIKNKKKLKNQMIKQTKKSIGNSKKPKKIKIIKN